MVFIDIPPRSDYNPGEDDSSAAKRCLQEVEMKESSFPGTDTVRSFLIMMLGMSIGCTSCCCLPRLEITESHIGIRKLHPDVTGVTDRHPSSPLVHAEDTVPRDPRETP